MDTKGLPAQSVKRKFYQWLLKVYQDDSFSEQANGPSPDVTDIAGLLRSSGFRLSNVDIGRQSILGDLTASGSCKVTLKCAKSGLCVTLESDSTCRCPPAACDDSASVWSVTSLSGSQESLTRGEAAGCSLLPRVPAGVAEVAGAATRCVMRLLDEAGGDPTAPPPAHSFRPRPLPAPRPPSRCRSTGNLSAASTASVVSSTESASDATRRLSEQLTFTHGLRSPSPASTKSLDGQQWCEVTYDLNEDPFRPPVIEPLRIRRQSSTVEEYENFERELAKSNDDSGAILEGTYLKIEPGLKIPAAKKSVNPIVPLRKSLSLESEAGRVLSKTESAIENMTVVLEYLMKLVGSNARAKNRPGSTENKKQMAKTVSAPLIGAKAEKKGIPPATTRTLRPPRLAAVLAADRASDPGPIQSKLSAGTADKRTPSGLARSPGPRGTLHSAAAALRRSLGVARGRNAIGGSSGGRSAKGAQHQSK